MFFLLLMATLAQQPGVVVSQAPLPIIENEACSPVDLNGQRYQRHVLVLRNVHTAPMMAWTLAWKASGQSTVTSRLTADRLFNPTTSVRPGDPVTATATLQGECGDRSVEVVAAHYTDGSTAGNAADIDHLFEIRKERVNQVELLLSVLKTTRLAEVGVSGRADVEALFSQVEDSSVTRAKGTVFEILGASEGLGQLSNAAAKPQNVPKAVLIKTIEDAVVAARSVQLRAGR